MSRYNRFIRSILFLLIVTFLAAGPSLTIQVHAQASEPPIPTGPPPILSPEPVSDIGPAGISPESPNPDGAAGLQALANLPQMKAVLIVGPLSSPAADPDWVSRESANMDLAAAELARWGVSVQKFYTPNTGWSEIVEAVRGAHFLLYRGEGIEWPGQTYGGLYLGNGNYYSGEDIRREFRLAPNAIVMMFACFSAGSAGWEVNLDSPTAQNRVAQYSDPFLDLGAAGYYSNWYPESFQAFISMLFQGKSLGTAYQSFHDYNPSTAEKYEHPNNRTLAMWLDWDNLWGGRKYDNAFAGKENFTLTTLFSANMTPRIFIPGILR